MGANEGKRRLGEILIVWHFWDSNAQLQIPFLTPVLYCCHSLSASGVVPKNSPTHSSSCHQNSRGQRRNRQKYNYRGFPESYTLSQIALASLKHFALTSNCPDFFWMVCTRLNKILSLPSTSPQANLQTRVFKLQNLISKAI